MTHLKKYWYWYLIAIVVVVAAILAYSNWETVKGWFSPASDASRTTCPTGQVLGFNSESNKFECHSYSS